MTLRDQLWAGLVAGVGGGVLIHVFSLGITTIGDHAPPGLAIRVLYSFVASALFGRSTYSNPWSIPIGLVLHFCVAIGWALGYVYLVRAQPQLLARPWISGAVYGFVVYVFMEIVLLTAGLYHRPSPVQLEVALVAHIVFYGIPVALIVSRLLRGPSAIAGSAA